MQYIFSLSILLLTPAMASAGTTTLKSVITIFLKILSNFIQIGVAAIVLGILYAVVLFMMNSDNEQKREQIKGYLFSAVIGLSVVMGVWGIVELLTMTVWGGGFGIPQLSAP